MEFSESEIADARQPDHPISSFLLKRWSPRSMTGESMKKEELMSLFEAARWAPSSYNNQPWIFIYSLRETAAWETLYNLQDPGNQVWTQKSSALILIASYNNFYFNGKPSRTHSFDTGAAWMALALEGSARGLVIHGMQGFNYEEAQKRLHIPHDYTIEAMIAVGKRAPKEDLPKQLQSKETPNGRKPLSDFVMEGSFQKKSSKP